MTTWNFKVSLCQGDYCAGVFTVCAPDEDSAYDEALTSVCKRLATAFPSLDIEVSVDLIE